jgi:hypothetical protein
MHATPFSRSATYDPATLKKLGETFDSAWASIACNFANSSYEAARLRLATLILDFAADAADGDCDVVELKCRAIGAMQLPRTG